MTYSTEVPVWRVHPDSPTIEVSNLGGVRSVSFVDARGLVRRERYRRLSARGDGYIRVRVSDKKRLVHNLVLETFVGPRPPLMDGMHLDAVRSNNRLDNLRWGTPSENAQQRVSDGHHEQANKTHCKNGHEFSAENTHLALPNHRMCKTCMRSRNVGPRAPITHCPHGHLFDEANSYVYHGLRSCKICKSASSKRSKARKRDRYLSADVAVMVS